METETTLAAPLEDAPTDAPKRRKKIHGKKHQYGVRVGDKNVRRWFEDVRAARHWQAQMRVDYERAIVGMVDQPKPMQLSTAVEKFKELRASRRGSAIEASRWDTYVLPRFKNKQLHEIKYDQWRAFLGCRGGGGSAPEIGYLRASCGLSAQTTNMIKNQCNLLYKWAMRQEDIYCPKNPIAGLKNHSKKKVPVAILASQEKVHSYLDACKLPERPEFYIFSLLALNTAQRVGQLMGLRWEDVDFETNLITFKWKWIDEQGQFVLGNKKADGDYHWLYMQPDLKTALMRWKLQTRWNRPDDFVAAKQTSGEHMTRNSYFLLHRKALKRAGLEHIKFHALRHTYATMYLERGGNIHDLKDILNHSSIIVTESYQQFNRERLKAATSLLTFHRPSDELTPVANTV